MAKIINWLKNDLIYYKVTTYHDAGLVRKTLMINKTVAIITIVAAPFATFLFLNWIFG